MPKFPKEKAVKLSHEKIQQLMQYRKMFRKCVRQRNVGSDNTKDTAVTMPMYIYTKSVTENKPVDFGEGDSITSTTSNETEFASDVHLSDSVAETTVNTTREIHPKIYGKGEVVVVRGDRKFMLCEFSQDVFP